MQGQGRTVGGRHPILFQPARPMSDPLHDLLKDNPWQENNIK